MTSIEERTAERVTRQWASDGWDVVLEPSTGSLPAPLSRFRLDAVAHRAGESRVLAVRSTQRRTQAPLSELAAAVRTLPGWTLVVEWVGDPAEAAPPSVLADRLRVAESLLSGDPDSALLLIWSSAEGAMLALTPPELAERPPTGLALANELYDQELLDEDDLDLLRRAQRLRNQVAHGRRTLEPVPESLLRSLADLAGRLLQSGSSPRQVPTT